MDDILPLLLELQPDLSKTDCKRLNAIASSIYALTGKVTQLGISRYGEFSYRTVQRFFHSEINWNNLLWSFFSKHLCQNEAPHLLVADETVITKSGKRTHGLDRFFSSMADKVIPGIACFAIALVNAEQREAYPVSVEQVVRSEEEIARAKQEAKERREKQKKKKEGTEEVPKRSPGRPLGSQNKNKEEVELSPELLRIQKQLKTLLATMNGKLPLQYLALDGHFGNHPSWVMVRGLELHIITKFRTTAELYFELTAEEKKTYPHRTYGERVIPRALPEKHLKSRETVERVQYETYQMTCRHKDFKDKINVVIVVRTSLATKNVSHVIFVSSDLALAAEQLLDNYSLRFQIEFEFRDAKGHFGLEDFMCVKEKSVTNSLGLSFFMTLLSASLLEGFREHSPKAGIIDLKAYFRLEMYMKEAIKILSEKAIGISCSELMSKLPVIGSIHSNMTKKTTLPSMNSPG